MFNAILALETGWTLPDIRRMPDKDYQIFRRLYRVCPFGPVRGDIQAWMTAQHVARWWQGNSLSMRESVLWFGKKRKKRRKPKGGIGRWWIEHREKEGLGVKRITDGPHGHRDAGSENHGERDGL